MPDHTSDQAPGSRPTRRPRPRQPHGCGLRGAEAVVFEPQSPYAAEFVEILWRVHGVRTITVSGSWRDRLVLEPDYPVLRSEAVSAAYVRGRTTLAHMARVLRRRHRVVAVIPHQENVLGPSVRLAQLLGLSWADQPGLRVARDKYGMRRLITGRDPALRVGRGEIVASAAEVLTVLEGWHGVNRFVLKPNDGMANLRVAIHDAPPDQQVLEEYFASAPPGSATLMEEYIEGDEFWVNGQLNHIGQPLVFSVASSQRARIHGKENVAQTARTLRSDDPRRPILTAYTERLMRATGLRRTPFHVELKLDEQGPTLIEVNVRLMGQGGAFGDTLVSGADAHDQAAHYYLHPSAYPGPAPDLAANDRAVISRVAGVAERDDRIVRLDGVADVEAMPEFVCWACRPTRGALVRRTVDLTTIPWSAQLAAGSPDALAAAEARARQLLRWNEDAAGGLRPWDPARTWAGKLWRMRPTPAVLSSARTWGQQRTWP